MTDHHEPSLGWLLLTAFRWFDDGLRASLSDGGWGEVTRAQSMLMASLDPAGSSMAELGRRLGMSRQGVHQLVQPLVDAGLLATAADGSDRRARVVTLTASGRRSVGAALVAQAELEQLLGKRIGKSQVQALRRALAADWGVPGRVSGLPDAGGNPGAAG